MHLRALITTVVSAVALGLAACGGDEETTSAEPTTAETTQSTATEATGETDPGTTALRERFNEQLLELLTTTQGMPQSQANCAIDALDARVSDEEIRQAIQDAVRTGEVPQDLIDQAFDAGADCAKR